MQSPSGGVHPITAVSERVAGIDDDAEGAVLPGDAGPGLLAPA